MKKKNTFISLGLALAMTVGLMTGCGGNKDTASSDSAAASQDKAPATADSSAPVTGSEAPASADSSKAATPASDKKIKVGIIQLIEHPALDDARLGFLEGMADAGYIEGENMDVDFQNAQGEQANCQTIAGQFATEDLDLILAIATPAAQAAANVIHDKPILVTAVTDPAAADLVDSNEKPGGNITGTSDRSPIDQQIKLLTELVPSAKRLTILYTSSETNSELQAKQAEEIAKKAGFTVNIKTVSSSNEIQQVVESAVGDTDALYIPTDNLLASSMGVVTQVANAAKIPVIAGEENQLKNGALATVGVNYKELGKQTAAMAVRILNGEKPADMPIEYAQNNALAINFDTAKAIGLEIPKELADKAIAIGSEKP